MSKIKILPENLANQIAAGEVVERPASVVKELLENAIDAGARHVTIQIEGDGTRLIRIIDDGQGMDEDDILLCLERHATSKLIGEEQLSAIRTLGFRGEAIPSIASVSRMAILSRPPGATLGVMADVRFGKVVNIHEMGAGYGTTMEVKNLFGNVPARKKFLKSARTELFHIEEAVKNYGAAYPGLGLALTVNGKDIVRWPEGVDSLAERAKRFFLKNPGDRLIFFERQETDGRLHIEGCLVPPELASSSSARLRVFVNGRVVRDRMMLHAVVEGLRGFLMKGRQPSGLLFLTVPPEDIDVNVHPTKQEVRFHKSNQVHRFLVSAVGEAMVDFQREHKGELFSSSIAGQGEHGPLPDDLHGQPELMSRNTAEPHPLFAVENRPGEQSPSVPLRADNQAEAASPSAMPPASGTPEGAASCRHHPSDPPLRIIGQLLDSYILCQSAGGFVAVDQHAAHERLLFEELREQYAARVIAKQGLLFPKVLECSPSQVHIIEHHREEIARLGVELEDFGGGSFVVKAVPALLAQAAPEEILAGIFERFAESSRGGGGARIDAVLSTMACKAAIKAGQRLEPPEMEHLLARMRAADIFSHCPHGRPVVKRFSAGEIKKWFHRT